jgi:hypothetical protein
MQSVLTENRNVTYPVQYILPRNRDVTYTAQSVLTGNGNVTYPVQYILPRNRDVTYTAQSVLTGNANVILYTVMHIQRRICEHLALDRSSCITVPRLLEGLAEKFKGWWE